MKHVWLLMAGLLAMGAAGCSGSRPTALNYNVLRLSGASDAAVFDAAAQALREHFTIRHADRRTGVLEAVPVEMATTGGDGRLGDVVAAPRRERRTAEVRVESAGKLVKVFCKVLVQECDTQAHQMFNREHAISDLPTDTPADRDAATTTEQNTVWRTKRRDRELENQILRAVREQLAGAEVL
ncbi:MAG: hypothetical protein KAV82_01640 [Phycisphaerae bacterium]|nr:hypothetical protein [Phycisphaerae bacterium]